MQFWYGLLADLIVGFHFLYVGFCVIGELIVIAGGIFRRKWVKNNIFRITHLSAVLLVAAEASAGVLCPLTEWEFRLREMAGQLAENKISFFARIVRSVIFYDFPAWVFTLVYLSFGALVALTFFMVPPEFLKKRKTRHSSPSHGARHGDS